jgi:hypothetical protein
MSRKASQLLLGFMAFGAFTGVAGIDICAGIQQA